MTTFTAKPFVQHWLPSTSTLSWQNMMLIVFGAALITLGAKVQVPFWPVPMTLQTLAIMLIAVSCGSRVGTAAVMAYLAMGLAGAPVFANTPPKVAGLAYVMGPTGGFLLGYVALAWIVGKAAERTTSQWWHVAFAALAGYAILYALGAAQLANVLPAYRDFAALYTKAFAPFMLADGVKIALAVAAFAAAQKAIRQ